MALNRDVYHFDKVSIIFVDPRKRLQRVLPLNELTRFATKFHLDDGSDVASYFGYSSRIEAIAPYKRFFEILDEHKEFFRDDYKISYIEIAKDRLYETKRETLKIFHTILKHRRKKYTHEFCVYDDSYTPIAKKKKRKDSEELYSSETGYWGCDSYQYVIYPRISKIAKQPCVHQEWRIRGASTIKSKTGITTLRDMINFDIEKWFSEQYERFLKLESINHEKHGRWTDNIPSRLNKKGKSYCNGKYYFDTKYWAEQASLVFCRIRGIETTSELISFYKNEIERVKHKVGRKTSWEKKVHDKLNNYKLNSFVVPYEIGDGLI